MYCRAFCLKPYIVYNFSKSVEFLEGNFPSKTFLCFVVIKIFLNTNKQISVNIEKLNKFACVYQMSISGQSAIFHRTALKNEGKQQFKF